ncbi:hypothetical protein, partial [Streptomyces noursei]
FHAPATTEIYPGNFDGSVLFLVVEDSWGDRTRKAMGLEEPPPHNPLRRRENGQTTGEHHRARQPQRLKAS